MLAQYGSRHEPSNIGIALLDVLGGLVVYAQRFDGWAYGVPGRQISRDFRDQFAFGAGVQLRLFGVTFSPFAPSFSAGSVTITKVQVS